MMPIMTSSDFIFDWNATLARMSGPGTSPADSIDDVCQGALDTMAARTRLLTLLADVPTTVNMPQVWACVPDKAFWDLVGTAASAPAQASARLAEELNIRWPEHMRPQVPPTHGDQDFLPIAVALLVCRHWPHAQACAAIPACPSWSTTFAPVILRAWTALADRTSPDQWHALTPLWDWMRGSPELFTPALNQAMVANPDLITKLIVNAPRTERTAQETAELLCALMDRTPTHTPLDDGWAAWSAVWDALPDNIRRAASEDVLGHAVHHQDPRYMPTVVKAVSATAWNFDKAIRRNTSKDTLVKLALLTSPQNLLIAHLQKTQELSEELVERLLPHMNSRQLFFIFQHAGTPGLGQSPNTPPPPLFLGPTWGTLFDHMGAVFQNEVLQWPWTKFNPAIQARVDKAALEQIIQDPTKRGSPTFRM